MLTGIGLKLSVLIAEDDEINQKLILLMLKKLGHHADVVANGIEVLQALERHYDVVLMDIGMPEMDGLQATKYIRHHLPAREQPRIIAVTAYALKGNREMCLEAGMDDFISKPVRIEELKSALQFVKRKTRKNFARNAR
jgi:CheY-like chemotaxis protein